MSGEGVFMFVGVVWYSLFAGLVGAVAYRRYLKWVQSLSGQQAAPPVQDETRMGRVEQAIDAIALEVERVSESQRFLTKVLTERVPERVARHARTPTPPSPMPGSVSSVSGPRRLM